MSDKRKRMITLEVGNDDPTPGSAAAYWWGHGGFEAWERFTSGRPGKSTVVRVQEDNPMLERFLEEARAIPGFDGGKGQAPVNIIIGL